MNDTGHCWPLIKGGHYSGRQPRRCRREHAVGEYLGRAEANLLPACTHT
jgi:hypothetical protein